MNTVELGKDMGGEENLMDDSYYRTKFDTNIGQKPENFEIIKLLGKGAYGKVYKVKSKLNNQIYAMKIFDKNIDKIKSNLQIQFSHPNIIKIYTNFESDNKLYIIMEYISNGNLKDFIILNKECILEEEQTLSFVLQCAWALYYIHDEKKIILRNIKPENILIDDNMKIKFGEFLSTEIKADLNEEGHPYQNNKEIKDIWEETKKYMSKKVKGKDNDVYSLGLVLKELLDSDNKIINNILKEMCSEVQLNLTGNLTFSIFEKISQYYSEKQNNSSIDAIVLCLKSFEKDSELFMKKFESANNSDFTKNEVIVKYYQLIKLINDKEGNFIFWNRFINEFRIALMSEILSSEGIDALEPNYAYLYLINIINNLSIKDYLKNNPSNNCLVPHISNYLKDEKNFTNSSLLNYINDNFELLNHSLTKNFFGLIRIKSTCSECKLTKYEFKNYLMIDFNPVEFINPEQIKNGKLAKIIELEQSFNNFNEYDIKSQCEQCLKITDHKSTKEIYSLPNSLVIYIRDNQYNEQNCINIKEEIELNSLEKTKKYELVAILKVAQKKGNNSFFYSFSKFKGKWFLSQRYKGIENYMMSESHKRSKNVRMLFYQLKV